MLDIFAVSEVQRRPRGEVVENRPQIDLFVELLEFVDVFLEPLGDWHVERLDDDAAICLRGGLGPKQQVVNLPIDELAVALEVLLIDFETGREPEEALES